MQRWVGQRKTFNCSSSVWLNWDEAEDRKEKTKISTHTHTQTNDAWVLARLLRYRMDGQSESISIIGTSQGKNGIVQEAGELMKLTKKQDHQYQLWGGREEKMLTIKRIDNHQWNLKEKNKLTKQNKKKHRHIAQVIARFKDSGRLLKKSWQHQPKFKCWRDFKKGI